MAQSEQGPEAVEGVVRALVVEVTALAEAQELTEMMVKEAMQAAAQPAEDAAEVADTAVLMG